MSQICSCCGDKLKDSKHYEVISRDARNHDIETRVDDLQNDTEKNDDEKKKDEESRKAEEHEKEEKEKKLESYRAEIRKMDDDEQNEFLESLRAQIDELKNQLKDLPDEEKLSKSAEFIGVHNYQSVSTDADSAIDQLQTLQRQKNRKKKSTQSQTYSVLTLLDQNHNTASGDSLLQRMGSVD